MTLHENDMTPEKALLVGVDLGEYDFEESLDELGELARSAGAEVLAAVTQKKDRPDIATCVGSGRLEEISEYCSQNDVDLVIFDCELSPTQIRNIEKATDTRTIDRTMLILDIFANNATTSEGKLQVELAMLRYLMNRLTGKGIEMSRQGGQGGIGARRGPGESKLETDRRHIRRRVHYLKEQLDEIEKRRHLTRRRRTKENIQTVAIVGYTNAGKSTLMNALTDAGLLAENKLFATLDSTSRSLKLPSGRNVLLIDTVGFIRKLPHHLVEAFKSTLEDATTADTILNICDISSPEAHVHLEVTDKILKELGADTDMVIPVFNKCDLAESPELFGYPNAVKISAAKKEGLDALLEAVENRLPQTTKKVHLLIPFPKVAVAAKIRGEGQLISEEYIEEGLLVEAVVPLTLLHELEEFEVVDG